jgi:hypothetical protein
LKTGKHYEKRKKKRIGPKLTTFGGYSVGRMRVLTEEIE